MEADSECIELFMVLSVWRMSECRRVKQVLATGCKRFRLGRSPQLQTLDSRWCSTKSQVLLLSAADGFGGGLESGDCELNVLGIGSWAQVTPSQRPEADWTALEGEAIVEAKRERSTRFSNASRRGV
jgi:hypothetical protein